MPLIKLLNFLSCSLCDDICSCDSFTFILHRDRERDRVREKEIKYDKQIDNLLILNSSVM